MTIKLTNLLHAALLQRAGAEVVDIETNGRMSVVVMKTDDLDLTDVSEDLREFADEIKDMPLSDDPRAMEMWFESTFMGLVDRRYRDIKGDIMDRRRRR